MPSEETTPSPLLQTKLYQPSPSDGLISRQDLLDHLERGRDRPLTLVAVPAGYGKTTLVADFLLVSDEYHQVSEMAMHNLISELLNHPARTLHLVLVSHSNPPLPLPSPRPKNQISELRRADFRFTEQETRTFLIQELDMPVYVLNPEFLAK